MENNRKLYEDLLKADGIDPAKITEFEQFIFRKMLDEERARMKRLSRLTLVGLWGFYLAVVGLCLSEQFLEKLHIPFVTAGVVLLAATWILFFTHFRRHLRDTRETGRRVRRLEFLLIGKQTGLRLVGRKGGRKVLRWANVIWLTAAAWLIVSLVGALVCRLLGYGWFFLTAPAWFLAQTLLASLIVIISMIVEAFKTPLDQLTEIKKKTNSSASQNLGSDHK